MNRIFSLNGLILLLTLLAGCASDPVFPDPGFDLLTEKNFVVRRDTADSFTIALNVKAPGGIDVIQILDGRTFDVVEELPQYKGRTDFLFNYRLDFSNINKNQDSTMIYNVRIQTQDNRAFNSSFKINLKKLSVPEIMLSNGDIIGTTVPVVGILGVVSTGIYKIGSVKIYVNGTEKYSVPQEKLEGKSEYRLETNIFYPFAVGKEDQLSVELVDERGQRKQVDITVKGIEPKKVKHMVVTKDDKPYGTIDFEYDALWRMTRITSISSAEAWMSFSAGFTYNEAGQVVRCEYYLVNTPTTQCYIDFNYVDGLLHDALHVNYKTATPDTKTVYDDLQNFKYRPDGTILSYDAGITTIKEIQYADGFVEGEKLFAERLVNLITKLPLGGRQMKTGFVPVINPLYIKGMPPIWWAQWCGDELSNLCWYKYMYTSDAKGYGNTESATKYYHQYEYSCDEAGQLQTFTWKMGLTNSWKAYHYEYYE